MRKSACARVKGVPLFIAGDMTYHALIGGYSTRKSIERDRPARQKSRLARARVQKRPPGGSAASRASAGPGDKPCLFLPKGMQQWPVPLKRHGGVTFFPSATTETWRCCRPMMQIGGSIER